MDIIPTINLLSERIKNPINKLSASDYHTCRRNMWLKQDAAAPQEWTKTNNSLANTLNDEDKGLQTRLEQKLDELEGDEKALLLVTDLEALHPYMRIGSVESQLQGRFSVPTVFLYPGVRTGQTRLKFLGFYPEDGNYRSMHVGG